jgi:hypothetical protein
MIVGGSRHHFKSCLTSGNLPNFKQISWSKSDSNVTGIAQTLLCNIPADVRKQRRPNLTRVKKFLNTKVVGKIFLEYQMVTIGSKIFFIYLLLMYAAQTLAAFLFTSYYNQDYYGYSNGLVWKTALMLAIGVALYFGQLFFSRRRMKQNRPERDRSLASMLTRRARIVLAIVFVALSLPFGYEYGFSFFHSGLYLSDLPTWVMLLQAMKPLARLDLAYCIIKILRGEKLSNVDLFVTLSYTIGGIISLSGAIDVIFLVLGFLLLYSRGQLVMGSLGVGLSNRRGGTRWLVYVLVAASLPAVAVIGFANKIGFERTYALISDPNLLIESFVVPLGLRVSSSHASFIANAELVGSLPKQTESLSFPIANMTWRACVLLTDEGCVNRADITHIARLNYTRTFLDQSPLKAGATPGLLASALYIPFLPFSILLLSYYCSLFTGGFDRVLGRSRVSFVGVMALVLFTYPVFENPVDLLVMFDPAVIYNIGLLFVLKSFTSATPFSAQVAGERSLQANGYRPTRAGGFGRQVSDNAQL